jgi:4-hydroxy-3-methylbut-2-enyl diphosphate reductase
MAEGRMLLILGDRGHPEVQGIQGYAEGALILKDLSEVKQVQWDKEIKYTLVVQTTYNHDDFNQIAEYLRQLPIDIRVIDTVCRATAERQAEAEQLSREVDIMIILGDPRSSNTDKLFRICKRNCERTYRVETIHNLMLNILQFDDIMGITAGASTPPAITEEAVIFMSDLENTNNNQTFAQMLDESIVNLHTGDVVKGKVIQILPNEVSVNLNYKYEGVIARSEITEDPTVDITTLLEPGQEIDVFVVRINDNEGNVQLSKKKIDAQKNFSKLEEAFNNKAPVPGKVIEQIKGGLIALINGVKVFVPSSQISNRYVEDLSVYKGKELNFNILELDKSKRRIVAGRKELATIEQNERKDEFFANTQVGDQLQGTVSRITKFGAFVDLGGVDGLIHISELSWGHVDNVKDVVNEGDEVKVTVIGLDKEKGKISLTLKNPADNPWNNVPNKYPIGEIVEGKVVRLVQFGAFVELEPGLDGLVHISQIANHHVVSAADELAVGDIIKVKVTDIDEQHKKISLSKKEADGVLAREARAAQAASEPEDADENHAD